MCCVVLGAAGAGAVVLGVLGVLCCATLRENMFSSGAMCWCVVPFCVLSIGYTIAPVLSRSKNGRFYYARARIRIYTRAYVCVCAIVYTRCAHCTGGAKHTRSGCCEIFHNSTPFRIVSCTCVHTCIRAGVYAHALAHVCEWASTTEGRGRRIYFSRQI